MIEFCLFIKDSISREADAFLFDQKDQPQTFSDFVKTDTQVEKEKIAYEQRINEAGLKKTISLGDMQSLSIWQYLLKEITDYDETTVKQNNKNCSETRLRINFRRSCRNGYRLILVMNWQKNA